MKKKLNSINRVRYLDRICNINLVRFTKDDACSVEGEADMMKQAEKYFIVNLWTIRFFEIKIFSLKEKNKCHKSNGVISRLNMQHLFSSFYAR